MPGLLRGVARTAVVAGTASAVSGRVRHRQDQKWAAQEEQQYAQQQQQYQQPAPVAPAPAPAAGGMSQSTIDQLKELAQLKEQGVLTEAEFEVQKAKLLG